MKKISFIFGLLFALILQVQAQTADEIFADIMTQLVAQNCGKVLIAISSNKHL
jgi:hypothetical protein